MSIEIRRIESAEAAEIFLTAVPNANLSPEQQAEELFSGIGEVLCEKNARILQERVFATENSMKVIPAIRSRIYGSLDDGMPPSRLVVPEGKNGQIAGIQVHAVCSGRQPEVLNWEGTASGRVLRLDGRSYLVLLGVSDSKAGQAPEQAKAMFEKAEALLRQGGGNINSVVRTWVWLDDILSWYDEFNSVRNRFFIERGLINESGNVSLPASTGIGIGPAGEARCGLDIFAVVEDQDSKRLFTEAGEQNSPYDYGSAFSRASKSKTPAGETVFVSGTAAVDSQGATEHVGDIEGQINSTVSHVRSVLTQMQCRDEDVVQAIVYCKTPEIEKIFDRMYSDLTWPRLTAICDICRDDLLFEIEATACPGAIQL
jgi:enamine deaminase RidA (YjgF/YER057c/UK114 family)